MPLAGKILIVTLALLVTLLPIYWLLILSLKTQVEAATTPPTWIPHSITIANYVQVFDSRGAAHYVVNSFVVAVCSSLLSLSVGGLAGYGLSLPFRGSTAVSIGVLLIRMIPSIVLVIPLFLILQEFGVIDTYGGLILTYLAFNVPFATWLMRSFFLEVPLELLDAGLVDGCGRLGVFVRIAVPLALPGFLAAGIFCFLTSWNEFLFALVLTRTSASQTIPVFVNTFKGQQFTAYGPMAAAGIVAIIPVLLVSIAVQRYWIRGMTLGAVKG